MSYENKKSENATIVFCFLILEIIVLVMYPDSQDIPGSIWYNILVGCIVNALNLGVICVCCCKESENNLDFLYSAISAFALSIWNIIAMYYVLITYRTFYLQEKYIGIKIYIVFKGVLAHTFFFIVFLVMLALIIQISINKSEKEAALRAAQRANRASIQEIAAGLEDELNRARRQEEHGERISAEGV